MITFAVSEERELDGTPYVRLARDREPSRRELSSPAEWNILVKAWRRLMWRRALPHDPFLSLNLALFNFSSGWDRLLQKQRQSVA